jgi:hypothetical protein
VTRLANKVRERRVDLIDHLASAARRVRVSIGPVERDVLARILRPLALVTERANKQTRSLKFAAIVARLLCRISGSDRPTRFTVRQTLARERERHGSPCAAHADVTTSDRFAVIEWGMH